MNLGNLRATSNLIAQLDDDEFEFFQSLATEVNLAPDEVLFRENGEAKRFFIIAKGIISLQAERAAKPPTTVQTVAEGSLLGLSWRLTPHRWMWTARAMTDTRLAVFDAAFMRAECAQNEKLDSLMWQAVAKEASERLQHTRIQLLDLYGSG